jgi:hypothetical protein
MPRLGFGISDFQVGPTPAGFDALRCVVSCPSLRRRRRHDPSLPCARRSGPTSRQGGVILTSGSWPVRPIHARVRRTEPCWALRCSPASAHRLTVERYASANPRATWREAMPETTSADRPAARLRAKPAARSGTQSAPARKKQRSACGFANQPTLTVGYGSTAPGNVGQQQRHQGHCPARA